ncbi:MAG: hypothetical protein GFH27_549305n87 [Chloroflexi bacterium AL-W]|nr:hypothetical protein [Chloroflexi bacterium AL-N1]NOK69333.1 hypothetical protein [Chloroflexi bacterium AL-N10]NOK76394.1 hypothetical protein [Chloroflexi bacterium AL-N5]NOK83511.1 hypothetical protein [Chloroflexi bacterium AL-W]NOK91171.1 hypothetical protein [Chloroflexi bacterium AL-N15]
MFFGLCTPDTGSIDNLPERHKIGIVTHAFIVKKKCVGYDRQNNSTNAYTFYHGPSR